MLAILPTWLAPITNKLWWKCHGDVSSIFSLSYFEFHIEPSIHPLVLLDVPFCWLSVRAFEGSGQSSSISDDVGGDELVEMFKGR